MTFRAYMDFFSLPSAQSPHSLDVIVNSTYDIDARRLCFSPHGWNWNTRWGEWLDVQNFGSDCTTAIRAPETRFEDMIAFGGVLHERDTRRARMVMVTEQVRRMDGVKVGSNFDRGGDPGTDIRQEQGRRIGRKATVC